jgi:hypothetical protein
MVLKACHIKIDATFTPRSVLDAIRHAINTAVHGLRGSPDSCYAFVRTRLVESLDVTVTPTNGKVWNLTDLLGRSMGCITETSDQQFTIYPAGHALETMVRMSHGPYISLDAALAAIEKYTRGVCRLYPGEDQS